MNNWIVIKFGGTSVSGSDQWQQILSIIDKHHKSGYKVMLVHSAFSGLTNALELLLTGDEKQMSFIHNRVFDMANLFSINHEIVNQALNKLNTLTAHKNINPHQEAGILSWGEWVTHEICVEYLKRSININSFDPTQVLIASTTDKRNKRSQVLSAKCDVTHNQSLNEQLSQNLYMMPGFVAKDSDGNSVVLGRGGSDTSAAYIASLLNAHKLEIWTDVHGIFSANPRANPNARLLLHLAYQEAREIAASGGAVLHPRCILPLEQGNIPLHIKNTQSPNSPGTVLSHDYQATKPMVYAINTRHQVTLVSLESINMWHQAGFLGDMFNIFKSLGLSVDLISTSQTNVTLSLDKADNSIDDEILQQLSTRLKQMGTVEVIKNCSAVTLVGYRIRAMADKIAPVISTFADQRIYITTQSSNDLNQTFVVDEDQADKLGRALHEVLIPKDDTVANFGPSWQQLQQQKDKQAPPIIPWWHTASDKLLTIASNQSPCYVYDLETITTQVNKLQSLTAVDKIHYACKANSHPEILQHIHDLGVSMETVSPQEIERVTACCGESTKENILFTPNFAPKQEYIDAIDQGILVTIDNPYILYQWAEIFADQEVMLRLDPGHGSGHHRYVRTAGEQSKFGIPANELDAISVQCKKHNIKVKGLHAHSGSGILDHENWKRIVDYLGSCLPLFPTATVLNIGGGLGIKENPGDTGLDFEAFNKILEDFKSQHPNINIWIEPGRFIVAHSGVLLAKVTQTKWKGQQGYIGLDTGMNSLIRPALYGAWHNIANLSKLSKRAEYTANIVGPMCETGDILGIDRKMPKTEEGDVILIANTGAYGSSMSSNYNLRAPAKNIIL
ncbi:bifunctional aspartate kinase/diaminopimelate decarboxylase [Marinicella rhabdoformis]|uniref:bifunctional aspartate kinase/diaminopimelate decarboxylase n=1 Tax=Marinicella rhabdoformis TaxID=2580566 RepID=UPI0012AECE26|nr:bifunctional aspartate kinase/diaminopimelate decarboxylase [Marinicella rhabdoformis]